MSDLAIRQEYQDSNQPNFYSVVTNELQAVQEVVLAQARSCEPLAEEIGSYVLAIPGKRIRPLLTLLAAGHVGALGEPQIHLAAVVECLHTAALLHDDVIDESKMRRGQVTAHIRWGNSPIVLVGDYLHARAFGLLVGIGHPKVLNIMADATSTIVEGEIMQLARVGDINLTEQHYREIICSKTATLFQACTNSAAALGDVDPQTQTALRDFGLHFGMVYQLIDDMLDYEGDSKEIGKNLGDDLVENKITLPFIHAYAKVGQKEQAVLRRSLQCDQSLFDEVLAIIQGSGALESARKAVMDEYHHMQANLELLDASPYKTAMEELASYVIKRRS